VKAPLVAAGDRVVFLGQLGPRGKHADVLSVRPTFSGIRLDSGSALLCLTKEIHPIPRRPRPDF
jgi:hypothetical protein